MSATRINSLTLSQQIIAASQLACKKVTLPCLTGRTVCGGCVLTGNEYRDMIYREEDMTLVDHHHKCHAD